MKPTINPHIKQITVVTLKLSDDDVAKKIFNKKFMKIELTLAVVFFSYQD